MLSNISAELYAKDVHHEVAMS